MPAMKGPIMVRAVSIAHSLRACSRLLIDHQPREGEGGEALAEEGTDKIVMPFLWRGQGTYNEDVPSHDPKAKGNC
jgi:hypothetical protein